MQYSIQTHHLFRSRPCLYPSNQVTGGKDSPTASTNIHNHSQLSYRHVHTLLSSLNLLFARTAHDLVSYSEIHLRGSDAIE